MIKVTEQSILEGQLLNGCNKKVMGWFNGRKVMIKGDSNRETFKEYFSSKLGKLIGLNINEVDVVENNGRFEQLSELLSLHYWENEFVTQAETHVRVSKSEKTTMSFFDSIIDNSDRHTDNYGLLNGKLFLIDHGLADTECMFNEHEYVHRFISAIKDPISFKYVENFINLTDEDIVECALFDKDITTSKQLDITINDSLQRVITCKSYLIKMVEEMKVIG